MKKHLSLLLAAAAILSLFSCTRKPSYNDNYMWMDCEGNWARLSNPDSLTAAIDRCKAAGFDNIIVDVKSIMGEVLYDSEIAPYMGSFREIERPRDYDLLGRCISYAHKKGMRVFASMNVFAGGHMFFQRGIIYTEHPEWQSMVYLPDGQIHPITDMKRNYNGMMNAVNPEVQQYELSIITELVQKYPALDGIVLDRMRFDSIRADFSDLSRETFETWLGRPVENFPEDIFTYDPERRSDIVRGPLFGPWITWRASVITNFLSDVRTAVKAVNPNIILADYTGAWYASYYNEGANWASDKYHPETYFDWAPDDYYTTGYAGLLDLYFTGLYYLTITKAEVDEMRATEGYEANVEGAWREVNLENAQDYWYCVEGGAEWVKQITCGDVKVVGTILGDQYPTTERLVQAMEQSIASTGGVALFDMCHLSPEKWADISEALAE